MKLSEELLLRIRKDLGIDSPFVKGRDIHVRNCWHFSSDGHFSDCIFHDDVDFRNGMNRVFIVLQKYDVVILAFVLMDNHVHFILYGSFDECNKFIHEYLRRTSIAVNERFGTSHSLERVPVNHQVIDNDTYLKTAICYVVKNPPVAGLKYMGWNYPWGSGSLYFNSQPTWTSSIWTFATSGLSRTGNRTIQPFGDEGCSLPRLSSTSEMSSNQKRKHFKTAAHVPDDLLMMDGMILPHQFVEYGIVEELFKSARSFNYFMCVTKEDDIEKRGGSISRLTIPDQEMREHRSRLCLQLFGKEKANTLNTEERLLLGRKLRKEFNSSPKQIARIVGLAYSEIKDVL